MDMVREKYNGVGFQIARTTLDDYRRRLDVAAKNEVRQKENMLSTLELLSTVRVGAAPIRRLVGRDSLAFVTHRRVSKCSILDLQLCRWNTWKFRSPGTKRRGICER